jgi:hypothetical protein
MPALVAGIHVFKAAPHQKTWMAGTSPAMTKKTKDEAIEAEMALASSEPR